MEILKTFTTNFIDMFVSMSFYIMLGLLFVGILNTYIDRDKILKHLGKDSFSSVVKASVIGVPLPLCSCGVVPTAVELKKSGASNGAVTSFLISTPQTGIDSMLATYSMMGLLMAIFRPVAAFFSGIIGGAIVNIFAKNDKMQTEETFSSCCSSKPKAEEVSCCSSKPKVAEPAPCCCSSKPKTESASSCCSSQPKNESKIKQVFTYAYGKFLDDIAVHFIIGMVIATFISTFLPVDFFINIGLNKGILAMFAVVLVGLPMYICSTASIPIALSLVAKGLSYGSAFAFLFTGPVTNVASLLVLSKVLGKKITGMYIGSVVFCSILFGLVLDFIIDTFNFEITGLLTCHTHHHSHISGVVAIIFAILIVRSFAKKYFKN